MKKSATKKGNAAVYYFRKSPMYIVQSVILPGQVGKQTVGKSTQTMLVTQSSKYFWCNGHIFVMAIPSSLCVSVNFCFYMSLFQWLNWSYYRFPGVKVIQNFITEDEEEELMRHLDEVPWDLSQSGRRKQVVWRIPVLHTAQDFHEKLSFTDE